VSFASTAMAATLLSRSCSIRIVSAHLLDAANQERVLGAQARWQSLRLFSGGSAVRLRVK
jgi:hypothetical protein